MCALAGSATAQERVIRQFQCSGNEPFWTFEATSGSAPLSRLSGQGPEETVLIGKLARLDFLRPPWPVWSGTAVDDPSFSVVATMRVELCRDTMSDETPHFDHRVVLAVTGEPAAAGCCRAIYVLDTASAPLARPETKPTDDWSRQIEDFIPAIRKCVIDGEMVVEAVLTAWPIGHSEVAVRVRTFDGDRFDCQVRQDGSVIEEISPSHGPRPGEGKPSFLPAREMAPILSEGRLERVVDDRGALHGWLHYASQQTINPAN